MKRRADDRKAAALARARADRVPACPGTPRRPLPRGIAVLAVCAGLGACGDGSGVALPSLPSLPSLGGGDETAPAVTGAAALPAPAGQGGIDRSVRLTTADAAVPNVYMALQARRGGTVSVVFATDANGDGSASDEPAIRLTPEDGRCNPQELRRFRFPEGTQPVFGRVQATRGVDPARLPDYMAVSVSRAMIENGLAAEPADTQPQNVCTRKLWQRLVLAQTASAAGQ